MSTAPDKLLEAFIREVRDRGQHQGGDQALQLPSAAPILAADPVTRAALATLAVQAFCRDRGGLLDRLLSSVRGWDWWVEEALKALIYRLLRSRPPFSSEQIATMLSALAASSTQIYRLSLVGLAGVVEGHVEASGLSPEVRSAIEALLRNLHTTDLSELRRVAGRLETIASGEEQQPPPLIEPGVWGTELLDWLATLEEARQTAWSELFRHAILAAGKSSPSKRWRKQAAGLVAAVGAGELAEQLSSWMEAAKLGYTRPPEWDLGAQGLSDSNQDLLKGLIWAAADLPDASLAHAVGRFAERCFRKIKDFGPASTRLGNACVFALGALPGSLGVAQLSRLAGKVRYASARSVIERALGRAAEQAGQTREDIEELAIPDLGLDGAGTRREPMGEHVAEVTATGGEVALRWVRPDGKQQKSVPKAVKEAHPEQVKALKKQVKEIQELLAGQVSRLERLWLMDRRLPWSALRERYLEHPLVGIVARRLLWLVEDRKQDRRVDLLWRDGPRTLGGEPVEVEDDAEARLWHVLDADDLERLLVWRDQLEDLQLTQPFKQLWREVYRPEDPKARSERRFSGHIIRQHPFITLCQQRAWQYTIQGYWDSHNIPTRALPGWGLVAQLEVDPVDHRRDDHIFNYLVTGEVRFFEAPDASALVTLERAPVRLGDLPPVVYSEVMRDVDLFIGSGTVANDPDWSEAGIKAEWRRYYDSASWGELAPVARTRQEVLEQVLPRTTLRDRARLEDRCLVVQGTRAAYRIHLGTANVRREGEDTTLAVVPDRKAKGRVAGVFLPFEGESMLVTILAKAFLLAEDESLVLE